MQDEILKVWQEKKQLAIMVTHDVDEAIYMGTRVTGSWTRTRGGLSLILG
ncbi:MAG: hypothetical protein ACLR0U_28005 [Enterocloster clostridioformis]